MFKELNHSDHITIKFRLETEMETIPVPRPWSKADWLTFKKELEQKEIYIPNKITPQRLEKILDQFYNLIEKALDKACPKQKEIIINRNNPWHRGTLKQLRLEKFARYEEYRKDRTNIENKTKYYNTLNKYRNLCRQKQKKQERDQTEAMGNEMEMSKYLNKILKNKAKKDIGTLPKTNGDYTTLGTDTLEELALKHYPTHAGKKETTYPNVSITKQEIHNRYNNWINEEKIIAAFKGFESKKSRAQTD